MARVLLAATFMALVLGGCSSSGKEQGKMLDNPALGRIRHVVVFKFKDTATPQQIREIEQAFAALPSQIPQIRGYEWGTNVSPEGLSQGFTHAFLVTFDDAKSRDAYLPHPAHKKFAEKLGPVLDKVMVVDYVAKK